ncbi:MAG: hypothetical protein ACK5V3_11795 [Bdellovibrionales bacterium]
MNFIFALFLVLVAAYSHASPACYTTVANLDKTKYYVQTGKVNSSSFFTIAVEPLAKDENRPLQFYYTNDFSIVIEAKLLKERQINVYHYGGPQGQPVTKRIQTSDDLWQYTSKRMGPGGKIINWSTYRSGGLLKKILKKNPFHEGLFASAKHIVAPNEVDRNGMLTGFTIWEVQSNLQLKELGTVRTSERENPFRRAVTLNHNLSLKAVGFSPDFSKLVFVEVDHRAVHPFVRAVHIYNITTQQQKTFELSQKLSSKGGIEFSESDSIIFRGSFNQPTEYTMDLNTGRVSPN